MAKSATERKRDQRDRDKLSAKEKEALLLSRPKFNRRDSADASQFSYGAICPSLYLSNPKVALVRRRSRVLSHRYLQFH